MTTEPISSPYPRSSKRSEDKIRALDTNSIGFTPEIPPQIELVDGRLITVVPDNDEIYQRVLTLLNDGFAGIIFTGPPGTSKSYYAVQIAAKLAEGQPERVTSIQFHPSYQYEDFVEGYVPTEEATGFFLEKKHLLNMCQRAEENPGKTCVIVIDELSRCDPGRVFGEALTYIEMTKRGQLFRLASGRILSIPPNLIFLATMNPMDRGVDEVDAAFERRFAKLAMEPSDVLLEQFLSKNGMNEDLRRKVVRFFQYLNRLNNPYCKVGHAYFFHIRDEAGLRRLWEHQLRFVMDRAFKLDPNNHREVSTAWDNIFRQERQPESVEESPPASVTPS